MSLAMENVDIVAAIGADNCEILLWQDFQASPYLSPQDYLRMAEHEQAPRAEEQTWKAAGRPSPRAQVKICRPANGKNSGNPNKMMQFHLGMILTSNRKIIISQDQEAPPPRGAAAAAFPCGWTGTPPRAFHRRSAPQLAP